MASAPEIRDGHYPYQVPIDAYGRGGFRFADMSHRGSLLALPSGMHAWRDAETGPVTLDMLAQVLEQADGIDVLLIGTGSKLIFLGKDVRAVLRERQIVGEAIITGGAVRTYNVLLAEKRAVAAALIAVENAR